MPMRMLLLTLTLLGLGACNTVEGAGEDISTAGQAISDEAEEAETSR